LSGLVETFGQWQAGTGEIGEIVAKILLSALLGGAVGAERGRSPGAGRDEDRGRLARRLQAESWAKLEGD
jgi:hypothetical protein